jgi:hypothetical protein
MSGVPPFERSVFVNCPFDKDYAPTLQAVAFCITDLGFFPRLAPENSNNGVSRLQRIIEIVSGSQFGIHDLSRCRAKTSGEYFRLNMPFELGIDHGCAKLGRGRLTSKSILVLEEIRYDYQKSLSDISGWDIEYHDGDYQKAVRIVRTWLVNNAGAPSIGAAKVLSHYADFQQWYWERERSRGASEEDIRAYPTMEFVRAMREWVDQDRPV